MPGTPPSARRRRSPRASDSWPSRSFSRSRQVRGNFGKGSLDLGAFALGQGVDLRRALARRGRLADRHLRVATAQLLHVLVESHALEQLDQERAVDLEVAIGEIHR